jgi:hypothetical protein
MQHHGRLEPSELHKLRQLVLENAKLKRLVVDRSLDTALLQEVLAKKSSTLSSGRRAVRMSTCLLFQLCIA